MAKSLKVRQQGFSLVELMVVVAMMGIVATAILSLYLNTQRSAITSEEVVEVQQNIRISMEQIAKDVRMAGFMVPQLNPAITAANATSLTLVTASATGIAARVDVDVPVVLAASDTDLAVTVAFPEMVDLFEAGQVVRILRPPNQSEPFPGTILVHSVNRDTKRLTLRGFSPTDPVRCSPVQPALVGTTVNYKRGDIIARTTTTAPNPNTVQYCLWSATANGCGAGVNPSTCPPNQTCLIRVVNGSADVIANNIAPNGLQFRYILEDDPETATPTAGNLTDNDIKGVRVTIVGQTATTLNLSGNVPKVRTITSVIGLRNR